MLRLHSLAVLLALASPALAQTTWYVDDDGTAPGTGTLLDPYISIEYALAQSTTLSGDTVEVAAGDYFDEHVDFLGKDVDVVGVAGAAVTTVYARQDPAHSWPVVRFANGEGSGARLAGFTLRGGSGEYTNLLTADLRGYGGGLFCAGASPTLEDLVITENGKSTGLLLLYGGGAFFHNSQASLTNCRIENNSLISQPTFGGGLSMVQSDLMLTDVVVRGNRNDIYGAGLYILGGSLVMQDGSIDSNLNVYNWGGGCYAVNAVLNFHGVEWLSNQSGDYGGALYTDQCSTQIEACSFVGNRAGGAEPYSGGAISAIGGSLTVRASEFRSNVGQFGGALFLAGTSLIEDSVFDANRATGSGQYACGGGAIYSATTQALTVRRCVFTGNEAIDEYTFGGGAVYGLVQLEACTLVGNFSKEGLGAGAQLAALVDCVVWGNAADGPGGTPDNLFNAMAAYSLVEGGWPGVGNIDADPNFWSQAGGDFQLFVGSPAIDAGDPASALDPDGTRADMGAFAFDAHHCGVGCDGSIGSSYCVATNNSTGQAASIGALGSLDLPQNLALLSVEDLPVGEAGYFLMSESQAFVPMLGGGQGNLCLGAPIVRLNDRVLVTNPVGGVFRQLDLTSLPQNTTFLPGSTWSFQYWYRDQIPALTSNTSQGLEITWN